MVRRGKSKLAQNAQVLAILKGTPSKKHRRGKGKWGTLEQRWWNILEPTNRVHYP